IPEMDAVTSPSTWKTRLALLPLTVTPAAGPVIVAVPLGLLNSSCRPVRVIVRGVAKTRLSKVMGAFPEGEVLLKAMASRRLNRPAPGGSASLVVFTTSAAKGVPVLVRANENGKPARAGTTV